MVLTGERRKEYDKARYEILKLEKEPRTEPKLTNKINRPTKYKKVKPEIKIVETNLGRKVEDETLNTIREQLEKTYGNATQPYS